MAIILAKAMKILHFSDTHLGYSNFDKTNEEGINFREQDFYDAFRRIVDEIVLLKPEIVIHTGDFFHRPSPSNRSLTFAFEQLNRLSVLKIPVLILAGNHSTPKTNLTTPILKALKTIPYIFTFCEEKYETFSHKNLVFHALPHINDPEVQKEEIQKISPHTSKINILMLHTSIGKSYLTEEIGEQFFPTEKYEILDSFGYVALGHWHNFQKVQGLKTAWYCGSTERMSETEINSPKGFCVLEVRENRLSPPVFQEIPTRKWLKFEINSCFEKTSLEILEEIQLIEKEPLEEAIVSVQLNDISAESSLEISNFKIREILNQALLVSIKRKPYQKSDSFLIPQGDLGSWEHFFYRFIEEKKSEHEPFLLQKMEYYLKLTEEK